MIVLFKIRLVLRKFCGFWVRSVELHLVRALNAWDQKGFLYSLKSLVKVLWLSCLMQLIFLGLKFSVRRVSQ